MGFGSWVNNNNNNTEIFEKFGLMMIWIIVSRWWKCELLTMIIIRFLKVRINDKLVMKVELIIMIIIRFLKVWTNDNNNNLH